MPAKNLRRANVEDMYVHVCNCGAAQGIIFNDNQDYEFFLNCLREYLSPLPDKKELKKTFTINGNTFNGVPHQPKNYYNKVRLISYSLMPDHFHLLLQQVTKDSLQKFMRSLSTRYSMYFNKKYQRAGSLFCGPYKSIPIENLSSLVYLTRYLHRHSAKGNANYLSNQYSSYADYLGKRKTPWVNTGIILSFFNQAENNTFKGVNGYKNFVEKYNLNDKEKQLLERIIIEKGSSYLESPVPRLEKRNPEENLTVAAELKIQQRLPEFAIASCLFAILFTNSFWKIWSISDKTPKAVLSSGNEVIEQPTIEPPKDNGQVSGVENTKPKIILRVKTGDPTTNINLRQEPNSSAKIIGKAKDGDTFEFVAEDSGWYEIILDDGSKAFVSATLMEMLTDQETN